MMFGKDYNHCSLIICSFLQPYVPSCLLGPNIFLSTLFSSTNSLCSSLNVRDQVRHLYVTVAYINNKSLKTFDIHHLPVINVQGLLLSCRPEFAPRNRQMLCISHKVCCYVYDLCLCSMSHTIPYTCHDSSVFAIKGTCM